MRSGKKELKGQAQKKAERQAHKDYGDAHAKVNSLNDKIANNQKKIDELKSQKSKKQDILNKSPGLSKNNKEKIKDKINDINIQIDQWEVLNDSYREERKIYSKMETDALNIINQGKK